MLIKRLRRHVWLCCIVAMLVVVASACYHLEQYNHDDHVLLGGSAGARYKVGFVEFDDQGVKYSAGQLNHVVTELSAKPEKVVIIFAHGWFHNAEPDDDNLAFFGEVLGQVSALETAVAKDDKRSPREVYGVFLGWRGAAWRMPMAKYLTFWNRKATAHRIGEREATNALIRLERAAYEGSSRERPHPTRLIIMGHSFGGALVYSALSQLIAKSLVDGGEAKMADAVLLFNPAFEAARWEHLAQVEQVGAPLPKIVALTSKTDRATGWVFPFGRWFNTLVQTSRKIENPVFEGKLRERKANNQAVGHFEPFITHDLHDADADGQCAGQAEKKQVDPDELRQSPSRKLTRTYNELLEDIRKSYRRGQETMHFGQTCLVPRKGLRNNQMNVFNIAMDRAVWDGHAFEQKDERRKKVLSFLTLLVPFVAGPMDTRDAGVAHEAAGDAGAAHRAAADGGVARETAADAGVAREATGDAGERRAAAPEEAPNTPPAAQENESHNLF